MRSGFVDPTVAAGTLRLAGVDGHYWSSRAEANAVAFLLDFNATDVHTSRGPASRYAGKPLRCLSTVLDM